MNTAVCRSPVLNTPVSGHLRLSAVCTAVQGRGKGDRIWVLSVGRSSNTRSITTPE